jgi:hypothetical protein
MVLQDLAQDELEDPLLLLVIAIGLVRVITVPVVWAVEESVAVQLVNPQQVAQSGARSELLHGSVKGSKVVVIVVTVVVVGDTRVLCENQGMSK